MSEPPIRVTMLSKILVVGAYQTKAEELARQPGIDLTVVVPPRWVELGRATELERRYVAGYELVATPIRFNGHFHVHYYPRLGGVLDRARPDVLHVDEEPYNLATLHALVLGRRRAARCVVFTWQNLYRRLPPPFGLFERYVLRRSDHVICGNEAALGVVRRKGYRGEASVIPQFGVPPMFAPRDGSRPARPFTVGFAGRLVEEKGLGDLLAACAGLGGEWRLRLIGHGPLREGLARRAAALGVAERVELVPPVDSTAMPAVLRELDVAVMASRTMPNWMEQFGRFLTEAMACGVAVVGSSSGEIPHVIGDAGLIFPEGDAAALRAQLARLRDEPGLREALAAAGLRRVRERYTQGRVAVRTAEVYRRVAGG